MINTTVRVSLKSRPAPAPDVGSWHEQRLRVRYEETDTMGVVYYAKYMIWMEVGRVNLLRDVGFGYSEWVKHELQFPVVQAHVDYKSPARFDDEVLVKTKVASIGNKSIRFENEMYKLPEMTLLATGHTVQVLTNRAGGAIPFPSALRERLISS